MATFFRLFMVLLLAGGISGLSAQESAGGAPPPEVTVDAASPEALATAAPVPRSFDQKIDQFFGDYTSGFVNSIFFTVKIGGYEVLAVVLWLAAAGVILTFAFQFVNIRSFGLALRTVRGDYSGKDDPGEVTHF